MPENSKNFKSNGDFAKGNTIRRPRRPRTAFGQVLDGLMKERKWTIRDLESAIRVDEAKAADAGMIGIVETKRTVISHSHIAMIVRGHYVPREVTMNRLLKPFGYRATTELRIEPIPKEEEKKPLAS